MERRSVLLQGQMLRLSYMKQNRGLLWLSVLTPDRGEVGHLRWR